MLENPQKVLPLLDRERIRTLLLLTLPTVRNDVLFNTDVNMLLFEAVMLQGGARRCQPEV